MPFIQYKEIKFHRKSEHRIAQAIKIINEYKQQGYTLTLRQLYYQFVARDYIPNNDKSYHNLGILITNARLAGLIDWYAIEDRGRSIRQWLIEEDETAPLDGIEQGFALDFWKRQNKYVEVWIEKDALSSVLNRPCDKYRIPYMPCKGYSSASELWRAGRRFERMLMQGRECLLIHLGDHDPSGIDMTRDNSERLELFAGENVEVRRIALNIDQVRKYNPPPNPAKLTDTRAKDYISVHGSKSWELDALEPRIIEGLIESEVKSLIDFEIWRETEDEETERRKFLAGLAPNWQHIREFMKDNNYDN